MKTCREKILKKSRKNCSIPGTCNKNDFFLSNVLKFSSRQLGFSFDKTSETFQTPSEFFNSQIQESMEKQIVQKILTQHIPLDN